MSINFKETAEYADFKRLKDESLLRDKMLYTETFGCQQNEADTEKIRGMLTDLGMRLTEDPSAADVIIINTCAIREHAELKALSILGHFKALKREKPELIVGVVGCMAAEPKRQTMIIMERKDVP
jgi:tRNA-2-methylthio-N6-dimethylallyladenosine synthase